MPLPLTDPLWKELKSSYGNTDDTVAWLAQAQRAGLSDDRLGDLINEVYHQGTTCTATYAVAPYLIEFAQRAAPKKALNYLIQAGLFYAASTEPGQIPCPSFLHPEFTSSAQVGAELLAPLLPEAKDFDTYKWAVAGLAGFLGHHSFARFLDGLDLYEGRFHHLLLDAPFPPEI